jgi:hypothetical protein
LKTVSGLGQGLADYLKKTLGSGLEVDSSEFIGQNAGGTPIYWDSTSGQYYDTQGNIVPVTGSEGE